MESITSEGESRLTTNSQRLPRYKCCVECLANGLILANARARELRHSRHTLIPVLIACCLLLNI